VQSATSSLTEFINTLTQGACCRVGRGAHFLVVGVGWRGRVLARRCVGADVLGWGCGWLEVVGGLLVAVVGRVARRGSGFWLWLWFWGASLFHGRRLPRKVCILGPEALLVQNKQPPPTMPFS
jgi:hypothetical protein